MTRAFYHQERAALALNPNDDLIVVQQGEVLTWIGEAETRHRMDPEGDALEPLFIQSASGGHLGRALFSFRARRYSEGKSKAFQRISRAGLQPFCRFLAACYGAAWRRG